MLYTAIKEAKTMYTVKEVADILGVSVHTVRYYDDQGLIPGTKRDSYNQRIFDDMELEWLFVSISLRDTGLPLKEIKRYIELYQQGDSTLQQRFEIMSKQREKTLEEIENLKLRIKVLDRVLKELKHYVADSEMQESYASPIKDLVRDKMVEYSKYAIDRVGDVFFYEVIPNVWHKHIVPLWNGAKDVLFSKELKIDQIKCETEYKVVENQSIFSETMTKEEVDAEKRKLLYHWIGLLSSLTKLRNAGELDVESTLAQLTEPMMIERVNALLGENPNLLETDKYILLHSLLGRDLYMEGQLIPIRAAEIKKVAKNNGGF